MSSSADPSAADAALLALAAPHRGRGQRVMLPLARRRSADLLTPVSAFLALRQSGAALPFLFESVEGGERLARYSFLGATPRATIRAHGASTERRDGDGDFAPVDGTVFEVLRREAAAITEVPVAGLPRLTGGFVGFAGYDTVRLVERLPGGADGGPGGGLVLPDALWGHYLSLVAFDHVRHQIVLIAHADLRDGATPGADTSADDARALDGARAELDALEAALSRPVAAPDASVRIGEALRSTFTREAFESAVRRGKEHIREGDIFQVVLSQRFSASFEGDAFQLYRALRQVNPSPYLFYFDAGDAALGGFQLVGSSPEVLVRVEADGDARRADVLPIAGTRPRGATDAEDAAHAADLRADVKERAEHLMLVDLGRNDLGRVCEPGSVTVDDYASVERYSHVMHLVSSVSGRVRDDADALDVLAATFPAGTVSGAPKVRAMEIIDALEPTRRGVYAGAVGYLDHRGNLDTCIAIRTMVVTSGTDGAPTGEVHFQAGAGVVADSDPAAEFDETVNKARALREAMRIASDTLF